MNRRDLLKGLMAGGVIVAGDLWIPGQKMISIPSGRVFTGVDLALSEGVCTVQICEALPGDMVRVVRVVAHYEDGPDPVEYMVRNAMGSDISIRVPMRGQESVDCEVIHARVGDLYSRFVNLNSQSSALQRQAYIPPNGLPPEMFKRKEYVFEDLS